MIVTRETHTLLLENVELLVQLLFGHMVVGRIAGNRGVEIDGNTDGLMLSFEEVRLRRLETLDSLHAFDSEIGFEKPQVSAEVSHSDIARVSRLEVLANDARAAARRARVNSIVRLRRPRRMLRQGVTVAAIEETARIRIKYRLYVEISTRWRLFHDSVADRKDADRHQPSGGNFAAQLYSVVHLRVSWWCTELGPLILVFCGCDSGM